MQIVFLHGLESGPHGGKYRSLAARFGEVASPDCEGLLDIEPRLQRARACLDALAGPVVLVGSSFGGLLGLVLAGERPEQVRGLVMLAPALHGVPSAWMRRPAAATRIVHGRGDDIVPIEASRRFAAQTGVTLLEVDDGHRLTDSHAEMLAAVQDVLASVAAGEG
ncbi:MAG: hypothetical protein RIT45_2640 [Pseudomonadota bacterium]|jgi:pimeloyl-ACP methyl ester carboxylesterase